MRLRARPRLRARFVLSPRSDSEHELQTGCICMGAAGAGAGAGAAGARGPAAEHCLCLSFACASAAPARHDAAVWPCMARCRQLCQWQSVSQCIQCRQLQALRSYVTRGLRFGQSDPQGRNRYRYVHQNRYATDARRVAKTLACPDASRRIYVLDCFSSVLLKAGHVT